MKTIKLVLFLLAISMSNSGEAQFLKRLGKVAEKAAKRTLEGKVDEKSSKETDKGFDNVFNKKREEKTKRKKERKSEKDVSETQNDGEPMEAKTPKNIDEVFIVNRKFDFVAGSQAFFEDNFEKDQPGDFPAKWDTNGSGELVNINGQKWLKLFNNSTYIPMLPKNLPENYSIEFDLLTQGFDKKTSSESKISIILDSNNSYKDNYRVPKQKAVVEMSPVQFIAPRTVVEKYENGERIIRNTLINDYRSAINKRAKISIMVNKQRMRVWLNQEKIVDVPRLIPSSQIGFFKLFVRNLRTGELDNVYVTNFRFAETGQDNRSKLLTEGRLSTNAILFESGSAILMSESFTIIREIAEVLQQNPSVKIKIIGHTDADGTDSNNLTLSKERAEAVKNAMIYKYDIHAARIVTDGKGESIPVASNETSEGKSQNRRVEFIKI